MRKAVVVATVATGVEAKYARGFVRQESNAVVPVMEITDEDRANAPNSIDWSKQGATSPVKDQGGCGSCWAFSATEGIESAVYMATKQMPVLSTQQVISCDKEDGGCDGGDLPSAFDYIKQAGGIATANDYPDTSHKSGKTGRCKWDKTEVAKVTGYSYAVKPCDSGSCKNQDEDGLAAALAKYGPISICLGANDLWDSYSGGVLSGKCSSAADDMDHCVQLVGYEKGSYWKVRNSWASDWGEDGFIRLPYGENACGLANEAVVVQATANVGAPVKKHPRGYVRQPRNSAVEVATITEEMRANAPNSIDWSKQGATSAVKDQGGCGSCWAFSTTEGIESAVYMATKQMPRLSTQQIISCDKEDGGCDGGDIPSALDYVEQAGGIDSASDYPDTSHRSGKTGRCSWDKQIVAKVTGYKYAVKPCDSGSCKNQDEDGLAAALAQHGPISICVNAAWDSYDGGILSGRCSGKASALDHCVQLVGYDKSAGYWKVRNSWASDWGENGFIRLPYGENSCGVADEAVLITATAAVANRTIVV